MGNLPPTFSEPPANSPKHARPISVPDVMMRVANDGPMYAVIVLVGVLALKGQASTSEMIITTLGALLARSWPRAVQVASSAGAIVLLIAAHSGCAPADARPAAYGVELEECNRRAETLQDSIACENLVRARYGRPSRVEPDAGR